MSLFANASNSERALVPVVDHEDPATNDSDVENLIEAPARLTCAGVLEQMRRRPWMVASIIFGVCAFIGVMAVAIEGTAGSAAPIIIPTTPAPSTTSTTTTTTTTTSTTTTSTTPSTTTTSSTTPSTTTTTTTTTEKPTTTTTTTTTTTEKPTPPPGPHPPIPTTHPLPPHPEILPAHTLLLQVGLLLNFTNVPCKPTQPPAFRYILTIDGVTGSYTGESNTKIHAQNAASMVAASDLFGISYSKNQSMPLPQFPCFVDLDSLVLHSDNTTGTTDH